MKLENIPKDIRKGDPSYPVVYNVKQLKKLLNKLPDDLLVGSESHFELGVALVLMERKMLNEEPQYELSFEPPETNNE